MAAVEHQGLAIFIWIFAIAAWLLCALPIYSMAQKKGDPNAWLAFLPIVQLFTLLNVADLEWWYFLLVCIPCVGPFVGIYIWMQAAEAMGKPSWVGILIVVPIVGFFVPFYIAYG